MGGSVVSWHLVIKEDTMTNVDMKRLEDEQDFEDQIIDSIEDELTDEQLLQMAEGSCSWGANCNKGC
jgi:hypothetical protein